MYGVANIMSSLFYIGRVVHAAAAAAGRLVPGTRWRPMT
jgi:hypothetical protein